MTPFEIFRTPIPLFRLANGIFVKGRWIEGSQITLSANFVTGNSIAITLNGNPLTAIPFTTDQITTMNLIAVALLAQPFIRAVTVSDDGVNLNRVLTIEAETGFTNFVNSFLVTGGMSAPTATIINAPIETIITASIQPTSGEDMQMVPEGRRDQKTYKLYTSTMVNTVESQNPDQVEIFGERYELIQVFPWQNNINFGIINHYKFIAMIIDELKEP